MDVCNKCVMQKKSVHNDSLIYPVKKKMIVQFIITSINLGHEERGE